ncbi:MbnP family protein [Flavobacterium sp.]|uniref:MbnP family protein n=1 Tax=Flavobacterium sp. TaxID=239 RepID=UPI003753209A
MIKNLFFCILFSLSVVFAFAQKEKDSLYLKLNIKFGTIRLELNKNNISKNHDTLQISLLKFYLSGIEIEYNNKTTFIQKNSYHLVDIENPNSLQIPICKKNDKTISKIKFNIGIDSTASVSGALAGDLDLQNGMYWAWQSGYINMKIEGKSSNCKTRKSEFQFHIGGYSQPNYAMKIVEIPIEKLQIPNNEIKVIMDLGKLFSAINLKEVNSIMIPGKEAMKIADLSAKIFSVE